MTRIYQYKAPKVGGNYSWTEKIVSALSYSPGMIGFVIGIIYILTKAEGSNSTFFRFHFYQAIFLGVCIAVIQMGGEATSGLLIGTMRLFEGAIGSDTVTLFTNNTILLGLILNIPFILLILYGMIWALLGKYAEIPFISKTIRNMIRG